MPESIVDVGSRVTLKGYSTFFLFERRTSTIYYIVASFCNFSTLFQRYPIKNQRYPIKNQKRGIDRSISARKVSVLKKRFCQIFVLPFRCRQNRTASGRRITGWAAKSPVPLFQCLLSRLTIFSDSKPRLSRAWGRLEGWWDTVVVHGSPPRARGRLSPAPAMRAETGNTPTGVGKTRFCPHP